MGAARWFLGVGSSVIAVTILVYWRGKLTDRCDKFNLLAWLVGVCARQINLLGEARWFMGGANIFMCAASGLSGVANLIYWRGRLVYWRDKLICGRDELVYRRGNIFMGAARWFLGVASWAIGVTNLIYWRGRLVYGRGSFVLLAWRVGLCAGPIYLWARQDGFLAWQVG